MLSRVAEAVPPPRKPRRPGGSFHLVYFYSGLPGRFFSACPPSPPAALPSPPNPTQGFALWRGRSGRGKKGSRGRRELGGVGGHSGRGGVCWEAPGKARRRGLCVAVATVRCRHGCCPRQPIPGGERSGRALPGRHRSSPGRRLQPTRVLSHGDQSERGWLGGKPREAFIAARVAARS